MSANKSELAVRLATVAGQRVRVRSYRTEDGYRSTVDNVDPGAVFARGRGSTREEAEKDALTKASAVLNP
jgi:hypothetical protein